MRRRISAWFVGIAFLTGAIAGQPAALAEPSTKSVPAEWYRVVVKTGDIHGGAGTQAGVWLFLRGANGTYGPTQLRTNGNFAFDRTSTFRFLVQDLGALQEVCVWRNDAGPDPMWYLDYIMVYKGETGTGGSGVFYQWIPASEWVCKSAV